MENADKALTAYGALGPFQVIMLFLLMAIGVGGLVLWNYFRGLSGKTKAKESDAVVLSATFADGAAVRDNTAAAKELAAAIRENSAELRGARAADDRKIEAMHDLSRDLGVLNALLPLVRK